MIGINIGFIFPPLRFQIFSDPIFGKLWTSYAHEMHLEMPVGFCRNVSAETGMDKQFSWTCR
jgi:hypothetical protein